MATEYPDVSMAELAADIPHAVVAGPFGSNLVSKDYVEFGVPVIRGQNVGTRWISGEFAFVSQTKAAQLQPNQARPGDIVFTQRGTLGQVAIVPDAPYASYVISQSQMKVTVDPAIADHKYVYYACSAPAFLKQVQDAAITAGVPHINLGILRSLRIPLPPLPIQRETATILGVLDDRIELLEATSKTLEGMIQTIFKSWFIDFHPVQAKAEGREPEGLDAATAALFPSQFVETDLGPIPMGWRIGQFGDVAALTKGTVNPQTMPNEQFQHYSLPAFDAKQMPVTECGADIKSNKTRIPADAVLMSKLNPHIPGFGSQGLKA